MKKNRVIHGDCIEEMKGMEENSVDAIVTDPPYNFKGGFMGKEWDNLGKPEQYQKWCEEWGKECLRILKPGGYMLAFSGTHSFHRLTVGIEDAGFEIKTTIMYLFGSGFPKSHNIGKSIDDKIFRSYLEEVLGHEPTEIQYNYAFECEKNVIGKKKLWGHNAGKGRAGQYANNYSPTTGEVEYVDEIELITEEGRRYENYGTALKPAFEPIVLAQKPREGTYAENVLKHGVGGLNIGECRIEAKNRPKREIHEFRDDVEYGGNALEGRVDGTLKSSKATGTTDKGRFPANVILDPEAGRMLDEQSGHLKSGEVKPHKRKEINPVTNSFGMGGKNYNNFPPSSEGGASRYFKVVGYNSSLIYNGELYLKGDIIWLKKMRGDILENLTVDGIVNGVMKEVEKFIHNLNIDGCGNNIMEKYLKDMLFTIKTLSNQIIDSKILNYYPMKNIETYIIGLERIINSLMELKTENVKNVENLNHFLNTMNERMAHIKGIAKIVSENICESGEKKIESIGTNTIGNTEKKKNRFFYCAKVHKSERNAGLEGVDAVDGGALRDGGRENTIPKKNDHPTLKPISLMRYLCRLVTPPGGIVLDPFAGTSTTACACAIEGFNYIMIEKEERYAKVISPLRIKYWSNPDNWDELKEHNALPTKNGQVEKSKSIGDFIK